MNTVRCLSVALIGACIGLVLPSISLAAGEPATVTVRVEGPGGQTLLPQSEVTTTTAPVPVQGGTCSGTSAGGALYDAVQGNWLARLEPEGVEIDGIEGVDLPSFAEPTSYAYWSFWLNNEFAPLGACAEEVKSGADIVFELQCYASGAECPGSPSAPDHFLTATAPPSRVLLVGESTAVTVGSLSTQTGAAEGSLPPGTLVSATGTPVSAASVAPGAGGVATLKFETPGTYTLQAKAPDSVPSDSYTVCVHAPGDGGCATTPATNAPSGGVAGFQQQQPPPYHGPFALAVRPEEPLDGHVYGAGHGPRILSGTILSHEPVTAVSLELRRSNKRRCSFYDGARGRFVSTACGTGGTFAASREGSYSYLLPAALPPGRYVLDVRAFDAGGDRTALARGFSRIVFYVR
jgi:hypothetical protein